LGPFWARFGPLGGCRAHHPAPRKKCPYLGLGGPNPESGATFLGPDPPLCSVSTPPKGRSASLDTRTSPRFAPLSPRAHAHRPGNGPKMPEIDPKRGQEPPGWPRRAPHSLPMCFAPSCHLSHGLRALLGPFRGPFEAFWGPLWPAGRPLRPEIAENTQYRPPGDPKPRFAMLIYYPRASRNTSAGARTGHCKPGMAPASLPFMKKLLCCETLRRSYLRNGAFSYLSPRPPWGAPDGILSHRVPQKRHIEASRRC
jgi:hypothetical protein